MQWSFILALVRIISAADRKTCVVESHGVNTTDDAPAIIDAFEKCGRGGKIIFLPTTYYVSSVMNITWLDNVEIDVYGTLLVCLGTFRAIIRVDELTLSIYNSGAPIFNTG